MTLTYPKAGKLTVGYDQKEDRLALTFHLQDGGFRKAFISRRILAGLLGHMGQKLSASHPMAGHTAQRDEVLQMEHVASVSAQNLDATASDPTQETQQTQTPPTEFSECFHVTDVRLELQQDILVVGFSGELPGDHHATPQPIAALGLGRAEAHRVLRLLRDKADFADWNLEMPALWMKPLEYGRGLETN